MFTLLTESCQFQIFSLRHQRINEISQTGTGSIAQMIPLKRHIVYIYIYIYVCYRCTWLIEFNLVQAKSFLKYLHLQQCNNLYY